MERSLRVRRLIVILVFIICIFMVIIQSGQKNVTTTRLTNGTSGLSAISVLNKIPIKGRAPKTGYSRDQFGPGWAIKNDCDTRNQILYRDLTNTVVDDSCHVVSGTLDDPYSGKIISFVRGSGTSSLVQIDHVVALSDAWQKGAQLLPMSIRVKLANDPLELLAVDSDANMQKGDGDAATWLPKNKAFRCQYVARQIAIKVKYSLWMTLAEHDTIKSILEKCPGQLLPSP